MPKLATGLAILLAAALALPPAATSGPESPSRRLARKLWTYVTNTSPFQEWDRPPRPETLRIGAAPHGPVRTVRANPTALLSGPPYAPGSIIVMASSTGEGRLKRVSLMYKVPPGPDDVETGPAGWFWAMYGPDGSLGPAGAPPGCVDCHQRAEDRDYVFVKRP